MLLTSLAACAGPAGTPRPTTPGAEWLVAAELPAAQQECAVVAFEGRVLVLGGFDGTLAMVDTVVAYDPAIDEWEALPPLPEPVHHANAAVLDGDVHLAGALGVGFAELGVHWVFDGERWDALDPMPLDLAVGGAGVAVLDGRLHLVGGLQRTRSVALHSVWDPDTGLWDLLPESPIARDHLALAAFDGGLVAAAGRQDGALIPDTERWDPATGDWTAEDPIPTPRGGVAAAVGPDGALHVVGGEGDPDGVFEEHESWDGDRWTAHPPLPTPRHGTGAAWVGDTLWIPGGATAAGFGAVATNEGWRP